MLFMTDRMPNLSTGKLTMLALALVVILFATSGLTDRALAQHDEHSTDDSKTEQTDKTKQADNKRADKKPRAALHIPHPKLRKTDITFLLFTHSLFA